MKVSQQLLKRFIKTLKGKIYKNLTANDSKSYIGYLNKLVDQYNNTYQHSIGKKLVDVDYSALTEKFESSHKSPTFKIGDTVRITKYKNISSKGYTEICSKEIFNIDPVLKANPWTYNIKDLNGEKIIKSFHKKELLLSIL